MDSKQNRKIVIDNVYNKIVSTLVKNNTYFKLPTVEYENSCVSGINEYFYPRDDISNPGAFFFHSFSYEFDDIIQEYKNTNNINGELNIYKVHELFVQHKDTLNDLSWLLTSYDV